MAQIVDSLSAVTSNIAKMTLALTKLQADLEALGLMKRKLSVGTRVRFRHAVEDGDPHKGHSKVAEKGDPGVVRGVDTSAWDDEQPWYEVEVNGSVIWCTPENVEEMSLLDQIADASKRPSD